MRRRAPRAREKVPMMPAEFQILLSLVDGDRHGYGIMAEIRDRTDGRVVLGPGTLYGTLKRLLSRGLVEEGGETPDPAINDERRRYYRLTEAGREVAVAEAVRLASLVNDAVAKQLIPRAGA